MAYRMGKRLLIYLNPFSSGQSTRRTHTNTHTHIHTHTQTYTHIHIHARTHAHTHTHTHTYTHTHTDEYNTTVAKGENATRCISPKTLKKHNNVLQVDKRLISHNKHYDNNIAINADFT